MAAAHQIVSGLGRSAMGRRLGRTGLDLTLDAACAAIADAGLRPADIDGLSTFPGGRGPTGGAEIAEVQDALRLRLNWYNGGGEGPGQLGSVVNACMAVAYGLARHVLVYRTVVEATSQGTAGRAGLDNLRHIPGMGWTMPWLAPSGAVSIPNWAAPFAQRYFHNSGATRDDLATIAITQRAHAALNPAAVYRTPLSRDDYFAARMISTPLCLFDCDVPVDVSTAVVISAADHAPNLDHPAVGVEAVGTALRGRPSWIDFSDVWAAAGDAADHMWERTTLRPSDVNVAELYDGFSFLVLLGLEAFGFCPRGGAAAFVAEGATALGGRLPVNTDGGQLSAGRTHGFGILHEACVQLRGEGGARQVPAAEVAAIGGGVGPTSTSMLLTRGIR